MAKQRYLYWGSDNHDKEIATIIKRFGEMSFYSKACKVYSFSGVENGYAYFDAKTNKKFAYSKHINKVVGSRWVGEHRYDDYRFYGLKYFDRWGADIGYSDKDGCYANFFDYTMYGKNHYYDS